MLKFYFSVSTMKQLSEFFNVGIVDTKASIFLITVALLKLTNISIKHVIFKYYESHKFSLEKI